MDCVCHRFHEACPIHGPTVPFIRLGLIIIMYSSQFNDRSTSICLRFGGGGWTRDEKSCRFLTPVSRGLTYRLDKRFLPSAKESLCQYVCVAQLQIIPPPLLSCQCTQVQSLGQSRPTQACQLAIKCRLPSTQGGLTVTRFQCYMYVFGRAGKVGKGGVKSLHSSYTQALFSLCDPI